MADNSYTDIMEKNHMEIPWHDYARQDGNILIDKAGLIEKASVIGRVGLIMLSCGTGAWRVRTSMNRLSKVLGVTCTVDVGLMSIEFNCFDGTDCISQSLSIANTGVNTSKLYRMEQFVDNFPNEEAHLTGEEIHRRLDEIEQIHAIYSPARLGLAAAIACCAFTFLLGGGPIEMMLAFIAAGIGNLIRTKLIKHHFTLFLNIAVSISASCFIYAALLKIAEMAFNVPSIHEAGYICSMLFIIPGFPFITSGIDLAKLDLRSGLERLAYAIIIVMVATMFAWIMALLLRLQPMDFEDLDLGPVLHLILRLIMSFFGVFGFSIMFNSPASMAATAALIGAIANSLRLELVDLTGMPAPAAAFAGALTAGAGTYEDIRCNEKEGRMTAVLTLEDGRCVQGSMERLERLYRDGVRMIGLTWNAHNCFGAPNSRDARTMSEGLTHFGREAVRYMNSLGMAVDVSHLSDGGFYDVASISEKPLCGFPFQLPCALRPSQKSVGRHAEDAGGKGRRGRVEFRTGIPE